MAGDGASVKSTTANGNGGWGIWAQPISSNNNVTFNSLTASHNGFTGIEIDGNAASLKSSTAFGNGDLGIDIDGEGAKVSGNKASGNGYGTRDLSGLGISVVYVTTPPVARTPPKETTKSLNATPPTSAEHMSCWGPGALGQMADRATRQGRAGRVA